MPKTLFTIKKLTVPLCACTHKHEKKTMYVNGVGEGSREEELAIHAASERLCTLF